MSLSPYRFNNDTQSSTSGHCHTDTDADDEHVALQDLDVLLQETTCPKNLSDGLVRGIGQIMAGAIGAVGIVVLSPTTRNHIISPSTQDNQAHKQRQSSSNNSKTVHKRNSFEGVLASVKSLGVGAVNGANVAAGSFIAGMSLIVKGLANTPSSVIQPRRGRWWSTYEGKWIQTHLKSELEWIQTQPECDDDILGQQVLPVNDTKKEEQHLDGESDDQVDSSSSSSRAQQFHVYETDLYDQLGVDPDASEEEIQHRYSQLARLLSPSRAGGDTPAAQERRRQIGIAYMILTTLRDTYDREGMRGIHAQDDNSNEGEHSGEDSLQNINPLHLYNMLFGSEKFDAYFGRLVAATEALLTQEKTTKITLSDARLLQKRRVTRLALQLAERLQQFVRGDEDTACQTWREEAKELCDSHYGVELVHLIGSVYTLVAAQFLGSYDSGIGMPSIRLWARSQKLLLKDTYRTTVNRVSSFVVTGKSMVRKSDFKKVVLRDSKHLDKDVLRPAEASQLGRRVLEALWSRTVVDVTTTIHEAAQMVLFDQDRNDDTRRRRGLALQALGTIFQKCDFVPSTELEVSQAEYQRITFHTVLKTILKFEIATRNASVEFESNGDEDTHGASDDDDGDPCIGEPCGEVLVPSLLDSL